MRKVNKIKYALFLSFGILLGVILLHFFYEPVGAACKYLNCDYNKNYENCENTVPVNGTCNPPMECELVNCPMSCTTPYTPLNCYAGTHDHYETQCTTYQDCKWVTVYYSCTTQKCWWEKVCSGGGGPTPTMSGAAYAAVSCWWVQYCQDVPDTCSAQKWVCETKKNCVEVKISEYGCWAKPGNQIIAQCQDDNPPVVCTAQPPCTPTCLVGQVPYDTGSPAAPAFCNYQTGNKTPGGECEYASASTNCWNANVPPTVVLTSYLSKSALQCSAPALTVGTESNNVTKVEATYVESDLLNENVALMLWFTPGAATPVITKVYDSGTGRLLSNDSFGLLVRKVSGTWRDIYVPGVSGGALTWVKAGTVGAGLRAEILGASGLKLVGIKNVSVSTTAGKITLTLDMQMYNEKSGIAGFEKVTDGKYNAYAISNKKNSFLPAGGDTIVSAPAFLDSGKDLTIDLNFPSPDTLSYTVESDSTINLTWKYSDSYSSIIRSIGDAAVGTPGVVTDTLDDTTSGILNYVLGSGSPEADLYDGYHLWKVNNDASRVEAIDLNNNEGGSIVFSSYGFDAACNATASTLTIPLGQAWMATKGGIVNTGSGSAFLLRSLASHSRLSADEYWGNPFGFYKDETDLSTEVLSGNSGTLNDLLHSNTLGSVKITSNQDSNTKINYWFSELDRRYAKKLTESPTSYVDISINGNASLSGKSTDISVGGKDCVNTKNCVVKVNGNLRMNSGFVCDARATFFVAGNLTIEPDITSPNRNYGCIFIVQGNATIADGTYKSGGSSYPIYDIVEAFIMADGIIDMPLVDEARAVRDGLKINGSIIAFGSEDNRSIHIGRSLKLLHNNLYPAVAVHFDNKYIPMAPTFFGGQTEGFEREVGFKPL